jgi:ParB family chromosome partitioning protein
MSKRTQSIRSMFAGQSEHADDGDPKRAAFPRVTSGAVRSLRDTFSDVEKENEALRARLSSGHIAVELDPSLIDPSPLADRFVEQDAAAFASLKASIDERGQEIPILVREHPLIEGRFQSAYGHRRVRAALELSIPVKAYIRPLSDEDLVVAQGLENSAREDLSFIERSVFASRLEDAGFQRTLIQTALSIDRAEVSKLIAVSRTLAPEIVAAIGRAPKIGRGRWQMLVDAMKDEDACLRVTDTVTSAAFKAKETDDRFVMALSAANKVATGVPKGTSQVVSGQSGEIGKVSVTDTQWRLSIKRPQHGDFAEYLAKRLPELFHAFEQAKTAGETGADE